MTSTSSSSSLIPLGIGMGLGVVALWLIFELLPFMVIGGAVALVLKGMKNHNKKQENNQTCTGNQKR